MFTHWILFNKVNCLKNTTLLINGGLLSIFPIYNPIPMSCFFDPLTCKTLDPFSSGQNKGITPQSWVLQKVERSKGEISIRSIDTIIQGPQI